MYYLFIALGFVAAGLGFAGIALPGLPSTPFFILSAYFFARSSPSLLAWVEGLPKVGPLVKDYRAGNGLPLRVKQSALMSMTIFIGFSCVLFVSVMELGLALVLVLCWMLGAWAIWYRVPTQEKARTDALQGRTGDSALVD